MEDLLATLLSFPAHPPPPQPLSDKQYDESIRLQVDNIRKISHKRLLESTTDGESILDIINPALNTIPYALALLAHLKEVQGISNSVGYASQSTHLASLWRKTVDFLDSFDPKQIRYIGPEAREIVIYLAAFARSLGEPGSAVAPIANFILRLDQTGSTLTSTHLLLCQLALESGTYSPAIDVLNHDILYLPGVDSQREPKYICSLHLSGHQYITPESGITKKISTQDIQEYFMLSGTIFIGLKQWERAAELLVNVVTYPVKDGAVSKIMVEAYKKWTLAKILFDGKVPSLPHITNGNAAKVFHVIGKPYDVVASLFESGSASRLKAEIDAGTEIWRKDGNAGLMGCILAAYQQHQIRGLSNLYRTISISHISESTFSAETGSKLATDEAVEGLIIEMISRGELQGVLARSSNHQPFLAFNPTGPALTESRVEEELAAAMGRIKRMMEDIKVTDHLLTHEKEYLRWAHKQKKLGDANSGDGYAGEELGWNIGPDDEDLMAA